MANRSPQDNPPKAKPRKLTEVLRGKIYARISMTGEISACWTGIDPVCTEDEFKKWRLRDADLRQDIQDAQQQKKIAQRAKFKKLTEKKLEEVLKNGRTVTQTIERTRRTYMVDPETHETKMIGFEVITGTTKTHDPFPLQLIDGLTKAINGNAMPVEDAIATLAGEGVLGEDQLRAIGSATKDYQQKLIGSVNGKDISDRGDSRETVTIDITDE